MFSAFGNYMSGFMGSELAAIEKLNEEQRKGNYAISFEKTDVNFDHLRRKRAFIQGVNIELEEEKTDKGDTITFQALPDLLAIKPKGGWDGLKYNELMATTATEEEQKQASASGTPGPNGGLFDYDNADEASKAALLDRFELVRKRQVDLKPNTGKPIALIFNPYCTSNSQEEIEELIHSKDIGFQTMVCEENLDPYRKAFDLEVDNFSALVAVGGDGTFNQMVNGMLARPDKKRLPVGLIPTGSANDMGRSIGLQPGAIELAASYIAKGEAIAVDTTRVLLDHEGESSLPEGEERLSFCRHMLSNAALSMPAKVANGASTWQGCFGSSSYSLSSYLQALSCGFVQDSYQLSIDDEPFSQAGIQTAFMMVNNGKFSSGGMIMNPFAAINDGLIDITWIDDPSWQGTFGVTGVMSSARAGGGIQAYQGHSKYVRGRKIRIDVPPQDVTQGDLEITDGLAEEVDENGNVVTPEPVKNQQVIVVDGEALQYEKSIIWECFPSNVEVLIDDSLFTQNKTFSYRLTKDIERDRIYKDAVEKIWDKFDTNRSNDLDRQEAKIFLQTVMENIPPPNHYDDSKFDETFDAMDKNRNGLIEKNEMVMFIKGIMRQRENATQ